MCLIVFRCQGGRALLQAAQSGRLDVVTLLKEAGADFNASDKVCALNCRSQGGNKSNIFYLFCVMYKVWTNSGDVGCTERSS